MNLVYNVRLVVIVTFQGVSKQIPITDWKSFNSASERNAWIFQTISKDIPKGSEENSAVSSEFSFEMFEELAVIKKIKQSIDIVPKPNDFKEFVKLVKAYIS
jgi:hypothetical protein